MNKLFENAVNLPSKFIYLVRGGRELKRTDEVFIYFKKKKVLSEKFTLEEIIESVSHFLGHDIYLLPMESDSQSHKKPFLDNKCVSGITLLFVDKIYIIFKSGLSNRNQLLIIFHEIAHLLLKHVEINLEPEMNSNNDLSSVCDSEMLGYRRTNLTTMQEREAERFAILMLSDFLKNKEFPTGRHLRWLL